MGSPLFLRIQSNAERDLSPAVPGCPLVHVVLAEKDSAFSRHQIQCALVEVGEVPGGALRRSEVATDLLHGRRASALRMQPRPGKTPDQWQPAEDGILNLDRIILAPLPALQVGGRAWLFQ